MWIFQNDSFLSVVLFKDQPDLLLVRSRVREDISRVLPQADVTEMAEADYRFRTVVTREELKAAMCQAIDRIDYPNFKDSVPKNERKRKDAYMQVWSAMARAFGSYGSGGG